jgi:glycosyltransferase involved in cell wall biosynthesis
MIGMIWREQVRLNRQAAQDRLDVLHLPALTAPVSLRVPLVLTLHDMIWRFPNQYSRSKTLSARRKLMEWYYRYVPELAARRAAAVITVSQAARNSIIKALPVKPERVFVTYEAASPFYQVVESPEEIEALRARRMLPQGYILAIGSADPRKNLAALVEAYALLPLRLRKRFALVIVWTHSYLAGEITARVAELEIQDSVFFLEGVSDEELRLLYNGAGVFAFPSRYEGFGLPVLEAMACGAPVVAANNSSIPEIAGEAAVLFDQRNPADIAWALETVLSDPREQARLSKLGLSRAATFSWDKCARDTIDVYREAVGR